MIRRILEAIDEARRMHAYVEGDAGVPGGIFLHDQIPKISFRGEIRDGKRGMNIWSTEHCTPEEFEAIVERFRQMVGPEGGGE